MKKVLIIILITLVIAFGVLAKYLIDRSTIFTGFAAKNVASGIFIANRTQESIEAVDINFFPVNLANTVVDMENKVVVSDFFGFGKQTAVYRDGLGCTLIGDKSIGEVESQKSASSYMENPHSSDYWPMGNVDRDTVLPFVNEEKLDKAIQSALGEGNTRSILVAYDTLIKWEAYAEGFDKNTPILGWSMSKSITSTMLGVLEKEGRIDIDKKSVLNEWKNDDRKNITIHNLMNMTSGLHWVEDYGDISEATIMLYSSTDLAKYAISMPMAYPPDSVWYYSSGTTNILSEIIKRNFTNIEDYWAFPYKEIFHKIGMYNTLMETDAAGTFVGSSYTYAPTRDWARYGLLYLNNGVWFGDTIVNADWVALTRKEAPNSKGEYGAQFWLNIAGNELPDAPSDIYYADGYQGQRVYIIPSKKLVIVRFGVSKSGEFDYNKFVTSILSAFEE